MRWYRLAADQRNPEALFNLGLCYGKGLGVEKDTKEAAHFYRLVAGQGYSQAQSNLGVHYENGVGVDKDIKAAVPIPFSC